ncbi:MAG: hypothetical protein C3F11_09350 [Methylocystaceae bacterium]|nr:MAG: hypothetical protein C3F11_09350 [Methylocystaceae bacterium]
MSNFCSFASNTTSKLGSGRGLTVRSIAIGAASRLAKLRAPSYLDRPMDSSLSAGVAAEHASMRPRRRAPSRKRRASIIEKTVGAMLFLANSGAAFPAAGQQIDASTLALCRQVTSDSARLRCYEDLVHRAESGAPRSAQSAKSAFAAQPELTAGDTGAWERKDDVDHLDRSPIVTTSLRASGGNIGLIGRAGEREPPVLTMRCKNRRLQVFVTFDMYVTGSDQNVQVKYRIGDLPIADAVWRKSEDGKSYGVWDNGASEPLLASLVDGEDFFVRGVGSNGRTSEALFQIKGARVAAQPVRAACGL